MVTLSEPNYIITNQVPSPSPFSKKDFSAIQSGNSLRLPEDHFEDSNHLALQRLRCHLLIRTIMRAILRDYQSFQSLSKHQVFSIPWTMQLVHTDSNQASCMALAQLAKGQISCQSSAIDFMVHRVGHVMSASRQRQLSNVLHENFTQSPNPFQHYW
ncbi:hypothetical protein O181_123244 [Austropuccinia psidii MF-1]|uniref:Uncharacterized protein n=1 Tax=Austropuccinia psidii MF-1 TaxID=1389203 RepID=A0A9Q3KM35_9BASI|nr:hypothetical protein [Austropuccinia psidii MF-1]